MAYMTYYSMEISEPKPTVADAARWLAETVDKTPPTHPEHEQNSSFWELVLSGEEDAPWYNHKEDMQALSKMWPDILFTLTGIGEEQDDQWVEYHMNGKVQRLDRPQWEPEPFDHSKLK